MIGEMIIIEILFCADNSVLLALSVSGLQVTIDEQSSYCQSWDLIFKN